MLPQQNNELGLLHFCGSIVLSVDTFFHKSFSDVQKCGIVKSATKRRNSRQNDSIIICCKL